MRAAAAGALLCVWLVPAPAQTGDGAEGAAFFQREIEPLLREHCYDCHSHAAGKMKGGLNLDSRSGWAEGGDGGPAVIPGKPGESLLIKAVRHDDPDLKMPPKKPKLADADIAKLERWVTMGAPDPRVAKVANADATWWSLKPIARAAVPEIQNPEFKIQNSIDAFILAKLREQGLTPSPEADPRTLCRRLYLDLVGLPPPPEEMDAFLQSAIRNPQSAIESLVDRLLASPRYGERWARHWLDVVHYGESNGFGMDRPRMEAWPYRDYVIASLNADKPYARFVQEQLAADALFPGDAALTPALGFAAAGPFNQSALVEQVDGTDCKRIALNLDRDDMVASTASTFLSMTVHCARCHEHKFDPISQRDYYRMQAVFAGVGRADRPFDSDPKLRVERAALREKISAFEKNPDALPPNAEERGELARAQIEWEQTLAAQAAIWTPLQVVGIGSTNPEAIFTRLADDSFLATGALADKDTYTVRAKSTLAKITALRLEVLPDDRLPKRGPGRQENGNLHLSEIRVSTVSAEKPKPLALQNASADFNQKGWGIERAIDGKKDTAWGIFPQVGEAHHAVFELKQPLEEAGGIQLIIQLDQLHGQHHLIGRFRLSVTDKALPVRTPIMSVELLAKLARPESERTDAERKAIFDTHRLVFLNAQLARLPAEQKVWAIAGDFAAKRNYKPVKEPLPIAVLRRGDIRQPLASVGPGALAAVSTLPSEFSLANPKDEASRRAALARWITAPENMLTWRSIVNRVWHWHFGRGLVDTPNDFGRMGSPPTHPELLDWLAAEFRDSGGSLKQLHRLIVTSAAYRQVSAHREDAARTDSDNRFLWRMNRPRLDAETVRDALLSATGKLDLTMGGPSAMQFKFDDPNVNVSPRIDYAAFDPDSPASYRRSVYRFLFRNLNDPLLDSFDAVDPSLSTPKRNATITPLQALSLWNNRFVLRQCEHLAARIERETAGIDSRIDRAFRLLCARPPTPAESALLTEHARRHGLASTCRVLVNSNEFLFVN
jgi:mono/diheme cytochrome c family protein